MKCDHGTGQTDGQMATGLQDQISPNGGIRIWMGTTQGECYKQIVVLLSHTSV